MGVVVMLTLDRVYNDGGFGSLGFILRGSEFTQYQFDYFQGRFIVGIFWKTIYFYS